MLTIFFDDQQIDHPEGPIVLGRDPGPEAPARGILRDPGAEGSHLRIEETEGGSVNLTCLTDLGVLLHDNSRLSAGSSREMPLPCHMWIGATLIEIERDESEPLATIEQPIGPAAPGRQSLAELGPAPTVDELTHWLESLIVDQSAASGASAIYEEAARAVVDLVGLDRAFVLLRRDGGWEVAAPRGSKLDYSRSVLRQVVEKRRTYFNNAAWKTPTRSLQGIEAVIASPILGRDHQVIGALYGSRIKAEGPGGPAIGELEARVVQILATHVGARLDRLDLDLEATRLRNQFEQFFSADLARALERDQALLEGRQRETTILFADIRGFSKISERLKDDPPRICQLVGAVMDRLTDCIRGRGGVVVDYAGDGLMAMWNAPADQEDHASRACLAVLDILEELPRLSSQWSESVGGPLHLGIGVNTGPVVVGNTGSRTKFKYGPLGHAVNLASRVEGATKLLGVSALITGATHSRLAGTFRSRRICRARVVGIDDAVDLYELHGNGDDPGCWLEHRDLYESALNLFEAGDLPAACRVLYSLLARCQEDAYDVPSLDLLSRAVVALKSPSTKFNPVLELHSK